MFIGEETNKGILCSVILGVKFLQKGLSQTLSKGMKVVEERQSPVLCAVDLDPRILIPTLIETLFPWGSQCYCLRYTSQTNYQLLNTRFDAPGLNLSFRKERES